MKKVFKKSVSVLMIVVMCLTMAPLQGFVGFDMSGWFASEAKAAAPIGENEFSIYVGAEKKRNDEIEYIKGAKVEIRMGIRNGLIETVAEAVTDSDGKATFKKTNIIEKGYEILDVIENGSVYASYEYDNGLTLFSSVGYAVGYVNQDKLALANYVDTDEPKVLMLDEGVYNINLSVSYVKGTFDKVKNLCETAAISFSNLTGGRIKISYVYSEKRTTETDIVFNAKIPGQSNASVGGYNSGNGCITTGLFTESKNAGGKQLVAAELTHELCHYILGVSDEYCYGLGYEIDLKNSFVKSVLTIYYTEENVIDGSKEIGYNERIVKTDKLKETNILTGYENGDLNKDHKVNGKIFVVEREDFLDYRNKIDTDPYNPKIYVLDEYLNENTAGYWGNQPAGGLYRSPIEGSFGIMQSDYESSGMFLSGSDKYGYLTAEQKANKSSYPEYFTMQYYINNESCQETLEDYLAGKRSSCEYEVCFSASVNADGEEYIIERNDYTPEYTIEEDNTELKSIGNTEILDNSIGYTGELASVDFSYADGEVTAEIGSSEKDLYAFIIDYDNLTKKQVEIVDNKAEFDYSVGDNVVFYLLTEAEEGLYHYNDYSFGSFDIEIIEGVFSSNSGLVGSFDDNTAVSEKLIVISDESYYTNGDFKSLGGSVRFINTDETVSVNGTLQAAVSFDSGIDFSSISVFKVVDGVYEEISKGYYHGEDTVAYTSFSYEGDGTYVVMAKEASEKEYLPVKNLTVESGIGEVDGAVYFSFEDANEGTVPVAYKIYHKNEDFTSFDDAGLEVITVKNVDSFSTNIDFSDDVNEKFFAVEILYEDGGKTAFGGTVKHQVKLLDSNNDGIPDIWLLKNGIEDHEGVAEEDPDYDGVSNLDEYINGTNPLVSENTVSFPEYREEITDIVIAEELFDGFPMEIIDLVADAMFNMEPEIDLSAYDISIDDAVALFSAIAKYYPTEYSLMATSGFSYRVSVSPAIDKIMKFRFFYGEDANLDDFRRRAKELNSAVNKVVEKMEGMNEFEKALYAHDYISRNGEYDYELLKYMKANDCRLPDDVYNEKYSEYSMLVNGTGVCGSYALAYRAVLNATGMECLYLSSEALNHAWNLVKVDGNWYHVDVCWDDSEYPYYGITTRRFFLYSDEEVINDLYPHYGWYPEKYKATSKKYSDMPRNDDYKQKYDNGKWYYLMDNKLYSSDVYGDDEVQIGALSASAIDVDDGHIYFAAGAYIYEYNPETAQKSLVYMTPKEKLGYNPAKSRIYNFYVDGEDVEVYKTTYNKDNELVETIDKATLQKSKLATITGIDISATAMEIDVLNSSALTASVVATESLEGFDFTLNWSSSNDNIVGIDQNGNIFAKNVGSATITASLGADVDGLVSASCEVTVSGDGTKGVCGDNALWSIDVPTKTLTISGTGALTGYDSVEAWPWHASRSGIENIIIEDGITDITKYAFMDMVNVKEIVIPDSVNYLRNGAFQNCTSLEIVDIGSGLKVLGSPLLFGDFTSYETVFKGCKDIEKFVISSDNTVFAVDEYGALIKKDGSILFKYPAKSEKKKYVSSETIKTIARNAFEYAENLEEIVLNDGITTILSMTFRDCVNLKSITLPNTLTTIYKTGFYNCKSLESIHLPKSFTTIESLLSYDGFSLVDSIKVGLFMGCENLNTITVENGNEKFYNDKFGALYETGTEDSGDKLWRLPPAANLKNYVVSENVSEVKSNAFNGCNNLEKILFEENVTSIGKIENLSNLEKIYILTKGKCSFSSVVFAEDGKVYCYESMLMASEVPEGRYWHINESHEHDYFIRDFSEFTDETDGYEYYKCFGCELDYSTVIHNNGEPVTTEATCTLDGNKSVECKVCDEITVLETIPATDKHNYQLISTTPGSCTQAPVYHYSCSVCGGAKDKTGTIDEGHKYTENVIEPTCTEKGYTIATCSECDETVIYDYKSPKGHKLDIKRKESYCSAHDSIEYSCKVCDYKEVIAPDAELLETTTVTVAPTCTKSGSNTDACNLCGATVAIEMINPLSHNYSLEYTVDKEATCTAEGQKSQHCTRCDAKRAITVIEATGHQNIGVINTAEATCTKNGYTGDTYCYDCETVIEKGVSTDILTHSYSSVVTPATCTEKGYTTYTCTVCSHSYTGDEASAAGHRYNDEGICDGCGRSRAENCTHLCHKTGFMGFIWKIVRFFWKLFKMNPVCGCGAKHW